MLLLILSRCKLIPGYMLKVCVDDEFQIPSVVTLFLVVVFLVVSKTFLRVVVVRFVVVVAEKFKYVDLSRAKTSRH